MTRQSRDRLLRIYEQMPAPKWVVSMGSCSCSGGVFQGGYNIVGGIDQVLPVDMYIFGCPCRPEAIIDGILKLLQAKQDAHVDAAPTPLQVSGPAIVQRAPGKRRATVTTAMLTLEQTQPLLVPWSTQVKVPEANRLDVWLEAHTLVAAVQALHQSRWGICSPLPGAGSRRGQR